MTWILRLVAATLVISGGIVADGCSSSIHDADQDTAARRLVLDWMRVRDRTLIGGEHRTFDPANVRFQELPSSTVPGLTYWWGYYAPPGTADAWVEIAAARSSTTAVLLQTPADLVRAIQAVGWTPADESSAIALCSEAVLLTGARSSRLSAPIFYKDSSSLVNERLLPVIARDLANMHRLTSPTIAKNGRGGWESQFWMIEGRQTTRYSCHLDNAALTLVPTDSIPQMGLLTPGP